ncbi:small ribosomal subunit protein bS18m [Euphorbia lathyris]|uniref:small ribosomal subunit protein bS18m n=1 Tax=Euphorbia lathyris TaxID=212925 RepID=UPI003313EA98
MRGLGGVGFRSISSGLFGRCHTPYLVKPLSTAAPSGYGIDNSVESNDESEQRMFDPASNGSFFEKLDKLKKTPVSGPNEGYSSRIMEGLDESFNTLSDGVDGKLKEEAAYFEYDSDEVDEPNYAYRPDMTFRPGQTYELKDLDLTKPGVRKPLKRDEFEVTTEEVLAKADFRNVRFLANFITEAGILIKRTKTGISAKAQRKVAREIKTARAFGLMPFTTMGTKPFICGRTMENLDKDFQYQSFDGNILDEADDEKDPLVS